MSAIETAVESSVKLTDVSIVTPPNPQGTPDTLEIRLRFVISGESALAIFDSSNERIDALEQAALVRLRETEAFVNAVLARGKLAEVQAAASEAGAALEQAKAKLEAYAENGVSGSPAKLASAVSRAAEQAESIGQLGEAVRRREAAARIALDGAAGVLAARIVHEAWEAAEAERERFAEFVGGECHDKLALLLVAEIARDMTRRLSGNAARLSEAALRTSPAE